MGKIKQWARRLWRWTEPHPPRMPPPQTRPAIFIPGSFAWWCHRCWGTLSTWDQPDERCPRCGGTLQFIATSLRSAMEPPLPRTPLLRARAPGTNPLALLTEFREPPPDEAA